MVGGAVELGGPHLVLPHVGGDHRPARRQLVEAVEGGLHLPVLDRALLGRGHGVRLP